MSQTPAATSFASDDPDHYELLNTIGAGSQAKVKLGQHLPTGTQVAVKVIQRPSIIIGGHRPIVTEARCMARLRHPNIVHLFQVINTQDHLFITMEYIAGGNLLDYIHTHGRMMEGEARDAFRQLVSAVQYCHEQGVIHLDIKPKNVLFGTDRKVKLTDFGISELYDGNKLNAFCGTPSYMAPEIIQREPYDGPPADVWSLGVLLYHMVTGHTPFHSKDFGELARQITKGEYTVPHDISIQLQILLSKLITVDPMNRSTLLQIMRDSWLNYGHREDLLTPFREPPNNDLDSDVIKQMLLMGFKQDQILSALKKKAYGNVMGTYLILKSKKSEVPCHTVPVSPLPFTDLSSFTPSSDQEAQAGSSHSQPGEQQLKDQESGKKSSGPSASLQSRVATPGPSLTSRDATPGPRPKDRKASPQPSSKWRRVIPRHSPKSNLDTPRPSPKSRAAIPRTSPRSRTTARQLILESVSRATILPPMPDRTRGPPPPHQCRSRTRGPPPPHQCRSRTRGPPPPHQCRSRTRGPPPPHQCRSRTRGPPPPHQCRSRTRGPPPPPPMPESDSGATTPPPMPESDSGATTPPPMPESDSGATTPPSNRESESATPSTAPQCGPGDTLSTHSASTSSGSVERRGRGSRWAARRCLNFLRGFCCCLTPRKEHCRSNKIHPL
ncbi:putative sperm motility kinase W isoform 1-T1 [Hipposideros larvatus]